MPGKHKVISVAQFIEYVESPNYRVRGRVEYLEQREYGVVLEIRPTGGEIFYSHFHVHFDNNNNVTNSRTVGHFKTGRHHHASQGWDQKWTETGAILFLLQAAGVNADGWTIINRIIVTEGIIDGWIATDQTLSLEIVFRSRYFKLDNWTSEAWCKFLDWNCS